MNLNSVSIFLLQDQDTLQLLRCYEENVKIVLRFIPKCPVTGFFTLIAEMQHSGVFGEGPLCCIVLEFLISYFKTVILRVMVKLSPCKR